jgi:hypothetical protein
MLSLRQPWSCINYDVGRMNPEAQVFANQKLTSHSIGQLVLEVGFLSSHGAKEERFDRLKRRLTNLVSRICRPLPAS